MMSHVVMTRTRWLLHLLCLMIQSCLGMALSLAGLWSYRERMILILGEDNAQFFYYFSVASLLISVLMLVTSFILISVQCSEMALGQGESVRLNQTEGRNQRRAYGAFGYYSLV